MSLFRRETRPAGIRRHDGTGRTWPAAGRGDHRARRDTDRRQRAGLLLEVTGAYRVEDLAELLAAPEPPAASTALLDLLDPTRRTAS